MIEIHRILCPVDFSEHSAEALRHAAAIARWYEAELDVLHVMPAPLPPFAAMPTALGMAVPLPARPREPVAGELARIVEPLGLPADRLRTVVEEGEPPGRIVAEAARRRADLVVMGTHGAGGFERFILGSVTEKVVRKAPCPVLTVPRGSAERLGTAPPLFKRILCPVDFSESSVRALEWALSLAREADAGITLLHVLEVADTSARDIHFDVGGFHRHLEKDARERLRQMVPAGARDWCEPREVVVKGKAWERILEVAADETAELIVMGVQERGAVGRMIFGSTAHHVVREAVCPVLTVRERH